MNKLKLAIDAARNDDMERVIKLLEEALAEQEVAEEAKTTSGMNSFERQEFLYRQSQDFKKSQGGNGW